MRNPARPKNREIREPTLNRLRRRSRYSPLSRVNREP